jgi:outer membrane protein assembly factor BamD
MLNFNIHERPSVVQHIFSKFGIMKSGLKVLVLAAMLGLAACSSNDDEQLAFSDEPADVLYNEGLAFMNAGKYSKAIDKFNDLDQQHPYSSYTKQGMVLLTFSYYKSGKYDEAIQSGKRFVTLHPGSSDAPYVQYLVSQSYYNQIPDITRDQERTREALNSLQELVRRYPDSEYAPDARKKINATLDQLAGYEMRVGRYYLERRNYIGAVNRFRTVVTDYQTTSHVEEALLRLVESYLAMGVVNEAQTAAAVLGHNFPDSPWYKDAYARLQDRGLEPSESRNSWMSKAFRTINKAVNPWG